MTAGILLAATSGLLWALNTIVARWGMSRTAVDPYVGAFVSIAGAAVLTAALAAIVDHSWVPADAIWKIALLGVILPGLGQGIFFKAIATLGSSRTGVIVGSAPVASALLALIFLDESWTALLAVGTVLTVVGGGLLAAEGGSTDRVRVVGVVLAVLTAWSFATRYVMARWLLDDTDIDALVLVAMTQVMGLAVLGAMNLIRLGSAGFAHQLGLGLPVLLLPSLTTTAALAALFGAFDRADVVVVSPINNATQTLGILVLGVVLLGRSEGGRRVVIAVALVALGAVLVGIDP